MAPMERTSRDELDQSYANGGGLVYAVVAGSHAYGLSGPDSDRDVLGCFVPRPETFLGFASAKQYRTDVPDVSLARLDEYAKHLVNGSSYWVESLFVHGDSVETCAPAFGTLLASRDLFLTQALVTKSLGFMDGMRRRARSGQDTKERMNKQLMHAVRVGRMMLEFLETASLRVRREDERAELLAMKRGLVPFSDMTSMVDDLYREVDLRLQTCPFPASADYDVVTDLVWSVTRTHWQQEGLL